jgi:AraC-like DNA-binding protein
MRPTIWLKPGVLIIYGASLDAATHKHNAIQLVWPTLSSVCKFNEDEISGPLIISSQVEHQLQMEAGWVLLVEPKSELGEQLSDRLGQCDAVPIEQITPLSQDHPKPDDDPILLLSPLVNKLGLKPVHAGSANNVSDERIQQLLANLNSCLPGDCLKPASWRAREVAEGLCISEGRFLHLFSEQMGITWRPYLLWHRVICAINALTKGSSATDAAHMAGFSDSAHLSRTFRSLFGMSIREGLSLFPKS